MQEFYRYLRPVTFDRTRFQPLAKTTGGVSFLVVDYANQFDGTYEVTLAVAMCPVTQAFDRGVAKKILDVRKQAGHTIKVRTTGLDAESLGKAIVHAADMNRISFNEENTFQLYLKFSIMEYADAIEYVIKSIRSAEFLSKASNEILDEMGIGDFYRDASQKTTEKSVDEYTLDDLVAIRPLEAPTGQVFKLNPPWLK